MAEETFDLKSLQSRINDIKKEGQESVEFTFQYIQCLMERHDLVESIPDDYEIEDVPDKILDALRVGEIPSTEDLILMDADTQNYFLFELIWLCGMTAIAFYTKDEKEEDEDEGEDDEEYVSTFDVILSMMYVSPGHWTACYLIAVFSLLMAKVPSENMIANLTNDFSDDPDQCQINMDLFVELASSVITRYSEDKVYLND
jgi:hypothetical protein